MQQNLNKIINNYLIGQSIFSILNKILARYVAEKFLAVFSP